MITPLPSTAILADGRHVKLSAREVKAIRAMLDTNGVDGIQWAPHNVSVTTQLDLWGKDVLVTEGRGLRYRFAEGMTFPEGITAEPAQRPEKWVDVLALAQTPGELPPVKLRRHSVVKEWYIWSNGRNYESPQYVAVNIYQQRHDDKETGKWDIRFFIAGYSKGAFVVDSVDTLGLVRQILARVLRAWNPHDDISPSSCESMLRDLARHAERAAYKAERDRIMAEINQEVS